MSYDRALTVFSPDGHLFQVEYAMNAVKRGSTVVGVRGQSSVVLAAEVKQAQELQDMRTVRKILKVDDHVALAFAGLQADARVLINKARMQCQSHRLTVEDAPKVEWVARTMQKHNKSILLVEVVGHSAFLLLSPGMIWTVSLSFGRRIHLETIRPGLRRCVDENSKSVRELLEEEYDAGMTEQDCLRVACRALLETAERGSKGIEIAVLRHGKEMEMLDADAVEKVCEEIAKEDAEEKVA